MSRWAFMDKVDRITPENVNGFSFMYLMVLSAMVSELGVDGGQDAELMRENVLTNFDSTHKALLTAKKEYFAAEGKLEAALQSKNPNKTLVEELANALPDLRVTLDEAMAAFLDARMLEEVTRMFVTASTATDAAIKAEAVREGLKLLFLGDSWSNSITDTHWLVKRTTELVENFIPA